MRKKVRKVCESALETLKCHVSVEYHPQELSGSIEPFAPALNSLTLPPWAVMSSNSSTAVSFSSWVSPAPSNPARQEPWRFPRKSREIMYPAAGLHLGKHQVQFFILRWGIWAPGRGNNLSEFKQALSHRAETRILLFWFSAQAILPHWSERGYPPGCVIKDRCCAFHCFHICIHVCSQNPCDYDCVRKA